MADIKAWHTKIGFSNLAGNKYDLLAPSPLLTEDEFKDFLLNEDGLVEIGGTLFKVTDDDLYLLTIQSSVLDEGNFADIAAGTFNVAEMNRFAVRIERDTAGYDLFGAIAEDPFGINEVDPGVEVDRKFWGSETTCQEEMRYADPWGNEICKKFCTTFHYAFWIFKSYSYSWVDC